MCRRKLSTRIMAMALVALLAPVAMADPLLNLRLIGRQHGSSGPYTTAVVASPGDVIDFAVTGFTGGIGVTNNHGYTVTSVDLATDGCNSCTIDLFENSSALSQVDFDTPVTFFDAWGAGPGASAGTVTPRIGSPGNNDLIAIHAAQPLGVFAYDLMFTGSFKVSTTGIISIGPRMRWSAGGTGLIRINSGSDTIVIDSITESSSDPFVGYNEFAVGYIPEPATGLLLSASMLLARHRSGR